MGSAALQRSANARSGFGFCVPLPNAAECKTRLLALQPNAGAKARADFAARAARLKPCPFKAEA
jgi:hypothetical protein